MKTLITFCSLLFFSLTSSIASNPAAFILNNHDQMISVTQMGLTNDLLSESFNAKDYSHFKIQDGETLTIDGDVVFEDYASIEIAPMAVLRVNGSLTMGDQTTAMIDGRLIVNEVVKMSGNATVIGMGVLTTKNGSSFEDNSSVFNVNHSTQGFSVYQGTQLIAFNEDDGEDENDQLLQTIDLSSASSWFNGKTLPSDLDPIYIDFENKEMIDIKVYQEEGLGNNLIVCMYKPQTNEYKIALTDKAGHILERKLAIAEESTYMIEEELLKGKVLDMGTYYLRVNTKDLKYVKELVVK